MNSPQPPLSGHVIVCGLGHVGYRIAVLLARLGLETVAITLKETQDWCAQGQAGLRLLQGDARDERLLRQAGVETARAILAVTNDDLANLSIAIDARRMNPAMAVVVRLFDQELAAHLEKSLQVTRVLSASALSAPAFVAAALGEAVLGAFEVGDEVGMVTEELLAPDADAASMSLGEYSRRTGTAVMALQRGAAAQRRPPPDLRLRAGDRLLCLSFVRRSPWPAREATAGRAMPAVNACARLCVSVREWWREAPGALQKALMVLGAIILASVGVFHFQLRMPWVDSLYFVVTTVATVGYGDYNLMNAPPWVKLFGSFVMLCGAAVLAVLFSVTTDLILSTRFRDVLAMGCSRFKGHVVVAGLGNLGFRLVRELVQSGETVVAIDRRNDGGFVAAVREQAPVVLGSAKTDETLRKAGIPGARALIAATDDDLANLSIGLAAKRFHPNCRVVLRIFDSVLAEKLQTSLGIDSVLSVAGAAAPTFVGAIFCPDVVHGVLLPDCLALLFARTVEMKAAEAGLKWGGSPAGEDILFVLRTGDTAYALAAENEALKPGDKVIGVRCLPIAPPTGLA